MRRGRMNWDKPAMNFHFLGTGFGLGLLALGGETVAERLGPNFAGAVLLLELLILPAILLTLMGFVLEPAVAPPGASSRRSR